MEKSHSEEPARISEQLAQIPLRKETTPIEEVKSKFSIDEFDQPSSKTDFGLDDNFGAEPLPVIPTTVSSDAGFSKLSRQVASLPKPTAETCEGYLNKKSPALFIKWQVRCAPKLVDSLLRAEEPAAVLL